MTSYTLSANSKISDLSSLWVAESDTSPIVDLAGYVLSADCDAVNYSIEFQNSGLTSKIQLLDLSRLKLAKTLPTNVNLWIDPEHPLPAYNQDGTLSTGFTANARCEIQLNGNFTLGGSEHYLPTEQRKGNWWSYLSAQPSSTSLVLQEQIETAPNDLVYTAGYYNNSAGTVTGYDEQTKTLYTNRKTDNSFNISHITIIAGGGVCIYKLNCPQNSITLNNFITFGTLIVVNSSNNYIMCSSNSYLTGERLIYIPFKDGNSQSSSFIGPNSHIIVNESAAKHLTTSKACNNSYFCNNFGILGAMWNGSSTSISNVFIYIKKNLLQSTLTYINFYNSKLKLSNYSFNNNTTISDKYTFFDNLSTGLILLQNGSLLKTNKNDFPIQTSIPYAYFHSPSTSSDVTWRYSDKIILPGKTLYLKINRLVTNDSLNSIAKIAITNSTDRNWYPETRLADFSELIISGIEPNKWYRTKLKYRNDSAEPLQVRVWECVTGSTDGGYLKVDSAIGGIF